MIGYFILMFIYGVVSIITSPFLLLNFIPGVDMTDGLLPFGLDPLFVNAMSSFKAFMPLFPPLLTVYHAFLLYLVFEVVMFILRLVLGHRMQNNVS